MTLRCAFCGDDEEKARVLMESKGHICICDKCAVAACDRVVEWMRGELEYASWLKSAAELEGK